MDDAPTYNRVELSPPGARYQVPEYDARTEAGAREALAVAAARGTREEREAVSAAVKRFWPDIFKDGTARSHFPNSNMNP